MAEALLPVAAEPGPVSPAPLSHDRLGTRLVLPSVHELRQRDLNRYMAALRESKLGDSVPEMHAKAFAAALKSGLAREARVDDRPEPLQARDVDDLHPARVRWFGEHVNRLYIEAVTIPPE